MFRRASKRAHRSRLLTFESLESRMCLSGGGVVALPGWGWDLPDTNLPNSSSAEFNQAITTDSAPQQSPSIAVDPQDPNHLVLAYMDFSRHNGYAGIGVFTIVRRRPVVATGLVSIARGICTWCGGSDREVRSCRTCLRELGVL